MAVVSATITGKHRTSSSVRRRRPGVPVVLDQGGAKCFVRLEGEVNITLAVELKTVLLQALASGKELLVDLERATEVDVTALQLITALERAARRSGIRVALAGRVPAEILTDVVDGGFGEFPISTEPGVKGG